VRRSLGGLKYRNQIYWEDPMRLLTALVSIGLLAPAPAAFAQDEAQQPQAAQPAATQTAAPTTPPMASTQRGINLAPMQLEPSLLFHINNNGALQTDATSTNLDLSADFGVMDMLQVGFDVNLMTSGGDTGFGYFIADGQYKLADFAAARLGLGAYKYSAGTASSTGFAFTLGVPILYKINDMLSFVSSRPYSWGITEDIFQMAFFDGGKVLRLNIPVGIQAQLHERVRASLRSGFALASTLPDMGDGVTAKYVPVTIDAFANVIDALDIGLIFSLPGLVDTGLPGNGPGYADDRIISIVAMYRWEAPVGK
jgi:hypothetical protein